ncbi:MAG: hypothetical protein GPOALKHO_000561 [Sodalis sp.]|nr:MAG: hypothetical protein GPOALKHO_000561 [Sodalis sp.]
MPFLSLFTLSDGLIAWRTDNAYRPARNYSVPFVQFIQLTLALFSAGLATFSLLCCVQPILPVLLADFGVSPAASSLFARSVSTGTMMLWLLFTGPLSDAVGCKSVMVVSLTLAASFTLVSACITS